MSAFRKIIPAVLLLCMMSALAAFEAKVIDCTGKVEVQKGDKWVALQKNDVLQAGAVISTGFKSEAVIAFGETTIKVKALTRLSIEQLFEQNGDKASTVYLDTGSISADVKPAENKRVGFTVKSPAATASVRGTAGEVYADGTVIGTEGKWCITPAQEKMVFPVSSGAAPEEGEPVESGVEAGEQAGMSAGDAVVPGDGIYVADVQEPLVPETVIMELVEETFDFSYPDDMGAVFVSAGETAVFSVGNIISPMDYSYRDAAGSGGTQLLSAAESSSHASVVPAVEVSSPVDVIVTIPERPKYGTVEVGIVLP